MNSFTMKKMHFEFDEAFAVQIYPIHIQNGYDRVCVLSALNASLKKIN